MEYKLCFQPLDARKFATVTKVIDRNIRRNNNNLMQVPGKSKAPLATPEPIEIGDYATVKVGKVYRPIFTLQ